MTHIVSADIINKYFQVLGRDAELTCGSKGSQVLCVIGNRDDTIILFENGNYLHISQHNSRESCISDIGIWKQLVGYLRDRSSLVFDQFYVDENILKHIKECT